MQKALQLCDHISVAGLEGKLQNETSQVWLQNLPLMLGGLKKNHPYF